MTVSILLCECLHKYLILYSNECIKRLTIRDIKKKECLISKPVQGSIALVFGLHSSFAYIKKKEDICFRVSRMDCVCNTLEHLGNSDYNSKF
ncbi:hypothetical protein FKM82_015194 [Ascaphus truei]